MSEAAILCVDDEAIILESLKEQLRRCFGKDYLYEVAESPEEALEILEDFDLDDIKTLLIVSDWLMPGMKGDEFLIEVHKKFPEITTIMLTGQADDDAIERAKQEANLFHCLRKPWTEEELTRIVRAALENS